jgi:hypothetical protein
MWYNFIDVSADHIITICRIERETRKKQGTIRGEQRGAKSRFRRRPDEANFSGLHGVTSQMAVLIENQLCQPKIYRL